MCACIGARRGACGKESCTHLYINTYIEKARAANFHETHWDYVLRLFSGLTVMYGAASIIRTWG